MTSTGFIRRRPFLSLLALLLLALFSWTWHERVALRAFPQIISAYTAKEYCSCRYVMNNAADYCLGYVKQSVPISRFVDDPSQRRVSAEGLGRSSTAVWVGEREGCRLEP
ncbi:amidase [Pseudomonas gingeri]|uniref:amidase n=1 Tax=Pseudomonas gingeri TaxID=117681 RepID=UPI0015A26947|nr:amidase [Pseudomonas gingeri]NVZ99630.1 amidase [Pseudomonas gingeri]NWA16470.1 amidase [Pseudomonas gingeri]NWA54144.1 amidase [Pseudomonas gingeri]NWA98650.1 amidase [Pseudomonas gingeri]NWB05731.1 amidase [Pseudomonas gingeri]